MAPSMYYYAVLSAQTSALRTFYPIREAITAERSSASWLLLPMTCLRLHRLSFVGFSSRAFSMLQSLAIAFNVERKKKAKTIGGVNWDFFLSQNWRLILHFHLVSFSAVCALEYEIKLLYLITSHLLNLVRRENVSFCLVTCLLAQLRLHSRLIS